MSAQPRHRPTETLAMRLGIPLGPVRDEYEERAAIREYCGGQDRRDAERDAMTDVERYFESRAVRRIG